MTVKKMIQVFEKAADPIDNRVFRSPDKTPGGARKLFGAIDICSLQTETLAQGMLQVEPRQMELDGDLP